MLTIADKIIAFNQSLDFYGKLPDGINIMNPFKGNDEIMAVSSLFYRTFYNDYKKRHLILGINPGRFGAGVTGIPFTDSRRLKNECGICYTGNETHEPSSVFIYDVIEAYGGTAAFYDRFYINSVCPLGFTITGKNGRVKNYNYYDSKELSEVVYGFIVENIRKQIAIGVETDVCFCFGTGKNEKFLHLLNEEYGFFSKIVALEHPRFIMQYKAALKHQYIDKYINAFNLVK